ncbi:MAG: hypothetical protein JXB50_13955 [Spirochaetes bacterium]|nr:hypothetical protein [Spirochaetota bacterium]
MKKTIILCLFIITIAVFGCKTIAKYSSTKKYAASDSLNAPESTLSIKETTKGEKYAELTSPFLGWSSLRGQLKNGQNGDLLFDINEIRLFGSWPNGWTEGFCEAYGKIVFKKKDNTYFSKVIDNLEIFEIKSGGIRYIDNFYIDNDGAKKVKERIERSQKLIDFLKTKNFDKFYGNPLKDTKYGISFKKATHVYLFPETKGFGGLERKKLLPDIYYKNTTTNTDLTDDKTKRTSKYQFAQGYLWNKDYTSRVFPEDLQALRNTGSLWRDYEEAIQIIFTLYNIDYYFKGPLNNSEFIKLK